MYVSCTAQLDVVMANKWGDTLRAGFGGVVAAFDSIGRSRNQCEAR